MLIPRCSECNSDDIILDDFSKEYVCRMCGIILGNQISYSPEWRSFNREEYNKKARCGPPTNMNCMDKGLSTVISKKNKDYQGREIRGENRVLMNRLRYWQQETLTNKTIHKNLKYALQEIDVWSEKLYLNKNIQNLSSVLYRKMMNINGIRGQVIENVVCAIVYTACRIHQFPIMFEDFLLIQPNLNIEKIQKSYTIIYRKLKLNLKPTKPVIYVPRFCHALKLPVKVELNAKKVINIIKKRGLGSGKIASGLAGAGIYISTLHENIHCPTKEIGRVCNITETTISNNIKKIINSMYFEVKRG